MGTTNEIHNDLSGFTRRIADDDMNESISGKARRKEDILVLIINNVANKTV